MHIDQIAHQLVMYLNCMLKVYLLYNFFESLAPVYEERKRVKWLEFFGGVTAIFLINHLRIPLVNTICIPFVYIIFISLNFRINLKLCFLNCIFYYLILAIGELAFLYIYLFLEIDLYNINSGKVILLIVQNILRFFLIQLIKQRHHIIDEKNSCKYTKSLFLLPVTTMILLNGIIASGKQPFGDILILAGSILMIVCNITIFSVIEKLVEAQITIKDNEMLILKTQLEKQHFQRIEEINEEYASEIHDIRHALKTIASLAERENNNEVRQISLESAEFLKPRALFDRKRFIEDTIANAIFSDREITAKEKGIRFHIDIKQGIDISFISDLDKSRIFGNLLDNAIEAAEKCEDGYISLELRKGNDNLIVFHLVNNFKQRNFKKGNVFMTIKDDKKSHGFGIKNVTELANKYNGLIKILEEGDRFQVTLLLSNVQKTAAQNK